MSCVGSFPCSLLSCASERLLTHNSEGESLPSSPGAPDLDHMPIVRISPQTSLYLPDR